MAAEVGGTVHTVALPASSMSALARTP
jgi:steroid delta-isomerase-like uncharacterized protein